MTNDAVFTPDSISGRCNDIYAEEIKKSINALKRFREVWLRSSVDWNTNLFQYADPDFYFFRFAISRQEKNTESFLFCVLTRVMERYEIDFVVPEETFAFIIAESGMRKGYRFETFYADQDVNTILQQSAVDEAIVLRSYKPSVADEWISRENIQYTNDYLNLRAESLETFFTHYFGDDEYRDFLSAIQQYLESAREITGYKSIKFYSNMNLAAQKALEEKYLAEWPYKTYEFQIIDRTDARLRSFLYFSPNLFPAYELEKMVENYVKNGLFRAMLGREEFAVSFLTSEWLYYSLKELQHFDYTAVISGYLKSVEQLLGAIVMLNVDNQCKIAMSNQNKIKNEALRNNIKFYEWDPNKRVLVPSTNAKIQYKYIDFTSSQMQYMDSSIGTFEFFLRNNPHIFAFPTRAKTIADMVSCFRTECRNSYFHTHNLSDWKTVEIVRSNAIYLYFVLLGGCLIPQSKMDALGFLSNDSFDELCKKIREFRHFNGEFIFEYADGRKRNLIYDFFDNTIQYTEEGIEHYDSLIFYEVEEFGTEAYEQLDEGIREDQIVYLRRDNLPARIIGLYRDGRTKVLFDS